MDEHPDIDEEGWFLDPYRVHEHRWFSAGSPTKLVRDLGVESYDPAPDEPVPGELVPVPTDSHAGPETLKRADDAERDDTERGDPDYAEAATDAFFSNTWIR